MFEQFILNKNLSASANKRNHCVYMESQVDVSHSYPCNESIV